MIRWLIGLILVGGMVYAAESCDPIRTFADGKEPLHEHFVSPEGDDEKGEGSRAAPYRTVGRALQKAGPGHAIRLLPGEYPGGITLRDFGGSEGVPVWIGGVAGLRRPIIRGGGGGMLLSRVRYLVLENLEIAGATGNGINCDDGAKYGDTNATHSVIFRNLFIHDIGTGKNNDGLKLSGVNRFFVIDCEFSKISLGGSAIDHVGCHDGLVARSVFRDCGNGVQCKGGSENIEIRWNRFVNAGGRAINVGGSTGFQFFRPPLSTNRPNFEAKNIRVLANTFVGSDAPIAFVGAIESVVGNNTIIDPGRWVLRILQETTSKEGFEFLACGRNEFCNNVVSYRLDRVREVANVGGHTDAQSFIFANNLWHAQDRPDRSRPSLPAAESNGLAGIDPEIGPDYRPAASSPVAGKGKRIEGLKADMDERCYADPPSVGAFEGKR